MLARTPMLPFSLEPLVAEAKRRMRRRRLRVLAALVALAGVGIGIWLAVGSPPGGPGRPPAAAGGPVAFEHQSAARAMASVFMRPSAGPVPASIARAAASLARGAPAGTPDLPGKVLVRRGRLLLSNLGPRRRAIYAFPTSKGEVCTVISGRGPARVRGGLGSGCMKAFVAGEPASVAGGTLYFPSTSGPPAEIAGVTEDGATGVRVVLDGTPRDAVYGDDAWYYRFPNDETPAAAATKLLVRLANGRTASVPLRIGRPPTGR